MPGVIGPKGRHNLVDVADTAALPTPHIKWAGAMLFVADIDGMGNGGIAVGNAAGDGWLLFESTGVFPTP